MNKNRLMRFDFFAPPPLFHTRRFIALCFYIRIYFFFYYLSSICPFQLLRLLLWLCEFRLTESISFILNRIMRVGHVCTNVFTVCVTFMLSHFFCLCSLVQLRSFAHSILRIWSNEMLYCNVFLVQLP